MATAEKAKNEIVIDVRFSFAQVWEPRVAKGSTKPKYSASLLWSKKDTATTDAVKAAFIAAREQGVEKKWKNKNTNIPLNKVVHNGDTERANNPEYKGMYFLSAKSDNPPGIGKKVGNRVVPVTDKGDFYSGCFGLANITIYAFNTDAGGDTIAVGLNHVCKVKDGPKLSGGGGSLEDAFGSTSGGDDLGLDDDDLGLGLDDDDL